MKTLTFSEVVYRDRKRQNMSQTELAERVGVHQQVVSHWEIGKNLIGLENLEKLVEVLGPQSELALNLNKIDFQSAVYSPKPRNKLRQREWVDLTFADMDTFDVSLDWIAGARWAAARLKEKNACK